MTYINKYQLLQNLCRQYKYTINFKNEDQDLIAFDPLLKFEGYYDRLEITAVNNRGELVLEKIRSKFKLPIYILPNYPDNFKFENSATKFRDVIDFIKSEFDGQKLTGVYGAFKYETIDLFEDLTKDKPNSSLFTFCLYDSFIDCDTLEVIKQHTRKFKLEYLSEEDLGLEVNDLEFKYSESEYCDLVNQVKYHFRQGDVFETVISNEVSGNFSGDPIGLYKLYAENVVTPYQYFYDFGSEKITGCSPELFLKISDNNNVEIRPISGTAKRSVDVIQDHENLVELLNSKKEKAELDMLIDLARNDLARFCEPGIEINGYRLVQKLNYVYHTYAVITGKMSPNTHPLDGVFACFNAGTLTGAPKVEAMKIIKRLENSARNYYGGCNGFYRFTGETDFAITIRTLEIKENKFVLKAGATLLNDSNDKMEYQETLNKMAGFTNLIKK
jgi:anthranilate synthase component 1